MESNELEIGISMMVHGNQKIWFERNGQWLKESM
jgi:hypothetical protein